MLALLGCGLALVALIGQVVSAQPVRHDLKPPFNFAERAAAADAQILPPGSTVLVTETFGASFAPVTDLSGSTPQWRIIRNSDDTAGYYWDKVGASAPITFSNSAWSAARLFTATQVLTPGISTYPAGQDSWLIYGPLDLSKFVYAHLSFEYYLDSQAGDTLSWGYSTDGQTFYGNSQSGPLGTWITDTFAFRSNAAFQSVYVAFAFNSHSTPQGKGAFVRNVRLTAEPVKHNYLSVVMNNYTPPTPTPIPPLYGYYFDETSPYAPGSDLNRWGGQYAGHASGGYGTYGYGQDVRLGHGNPTNSLTLYTTASYITAGASPNSPDDHAPANFDLYVDTSPWRLYPSDYYGVIFGAGDGVFGSNPGDFNGSGSFYFLYYGTGDTSVQTKGIRLDVCSGGHCDRLSGNSGNNGFVKVPTSFVGNSSAWDTLHVQRDGDTITVWVNNTQVMSVVDTTYTGSRKWGLGIIASINDPTYPPVGGEMAVDFDNIKLYSR